MMNIFSQLLDLLAPPPKEVLLLRTETTTSFIRTFSKESNFDITTLASYQNPTVKSAITANKFYNYKPASDLLATLVNKWLNDQPTKNIYLIPIPLGHARQKDRGYNQVTRVLTKISSQNLVLLPVIERVIETIPQTSLNRKARLQNLEGAFTVKLPLAITPNSRVVIVDDVITTGTTLKVAKDCLKPHLTADCELILLAFAH
jgi:ComF family protein